MKELKKFANIIFKIEYQNHLHLIILREKKKLYQQLELVEITGLPKCFLNFMKKCKFSTNSIIRVQFKAAINLRKNMLRPTMHRARPGVHGA